MTFIWLVRHGEAEAFDDSRSDEQRALTRNGVDTVRRMSEWLANRSAKPDGILHSPLVRTTQTAEIWGQAFGVTPRDEPRLEPGLSCARLIETVAVYSGQTVVCVGHQPDMSGILSQLIGGGRHEFSPGTAACIETGDIVVPGSAILKCLLPPSLFGG